MSMLKLTWRSIRSFFGRYMALFLIVALSVGFFSGFKLTKNAMVGTYADYIERQHFYDYRVLSTLPFTQEDVEVLSELAFVDAAEGTLSADLLLTDGTGALAFKLISLSQTVNVPELTAGRLPQSAGEVLADERKFDTADIGSTLSVPVRDTDGTALFQTTDFTIVGLARSPLYVGNERGTASVGNGAMHAFLYTPQSSFSRDVYTEINLTLKESPAVYSEEYDARVEEHKAAVTETARTLTEKKYADLLSEKGLTAETAALMGVSAPQVYVLTRNENAGYVSFENDTSIISGIANIFPLFFVFIAMLVCVTTVSRMVDEERTQNGVLLAMGFGERAVMAKYLLYAGSATVPGWAVGFFLGTWGLPKLFWFAFGALYDFAPLGYLFSPLWAAVTLGVSLVGILGSTFLSCAKGLSEKPAVLIRPKAAKKGKRILLERCQGLWRHLTFLQKITLRNMFRYKRRLVMMLVGIGCCAGLVLAAFGVRDSMLPIGKGQYETVQKYDIEVSFSGEWETLADQLAKTQGVKSVMPCVTQRVDLQNDDTMATVNLVAFATDEGLRDYWGFAADGEPLPFPQKGEMLISRRTGEKFGISVGDSMTVRNADRKELVLAVSGVFDNYIDGFAVLSRETYEMGFGTFSENTALVLANGDCNALAEQITAMPQVSSVTKLADRQERIDGALSCINYIIWIVILFAGALAFVVTFNLTNINLAERSREIATVQVLGFYPKETQSYVLRENLVLSAIAAFLGLPLGVLFHLIVMDTLVIDFLSFDTQIRPMSFVLSVVCTVIFAVLVNLFMKRRISNIPMVESLKAVE